jgi:hypothetical protein
VRRTKASVLLVAMVAGLLTAVAAPAPASVPGPSDPRRSIAGEDTGSDPRHWRPGRPTPPPRSAARANADAQLTVSVRDRSGAAPSTEHAGYALAFDLATGELTVVPLTDGEGSAQLTPGAYLVQAFVETPEANGRLSLSMPMRTRVAVAGDTRTTLHAAGTVRVTAGVDRPDARLYGGTVQVTQRTPGELIWYAADFDYAGGLHVQPTGWAVPGLDLHVYAALARNGAPTSPYLYHLRFRTADGIPPRPAFTARTATLAAVTMRVDGQGRAACGRIGARGYDPRLPVGLGASVTAGPVPGTYQAYFTPGDDVLWSLRAQVLPADCAQESGGDTFVTERTFPAAGPYAVTLGRAPLGPTVTRSGNPYASWPAAREGDVLRFAIPAYADAAARHGGPTADFATDYPATTGTTTLSLPDGTILGSTDRTAFGDFPVSGEEQRYVLTTEAARDAPWSALSTRQRTVWTFTSARAGQASPLPLLTVRYEAKLDAQGRAPAGTPFAFDVAVEQNGPQRPVASLTLSASFDDGLTWRPVALSRTGDRWTARLSHPAAGFVSLRATATDRDGNAVDQTMIRAYGLAGPG